MSLVAAQLVARIDAQTEGAEAGMLRTSGLLSKLHGGFQSAVHGMMSFVGGQIIFAGIARAVGEVENQIKDAAAQFNQFQAAQAQTNAVLASTKGVAGVTAQTVNQLADSFANTTKFSRDTVQGTENLLLTFTDIKDNIFPQATQVTLDMAQALGEDTKSAAIQLGKALQDPVLGATALRRVGVNLSSTQMDLIKGFVASGDKAKAQSVIMKELTNEFGGSAKAAGQTFGGQLDILGHQMDAMKVKTVQGLLPGLQSLVTNITPLVTLIGDKLPGALVGAQHFLGDLVSHFEAGFDAGHGQKVTTLTNLVSNLGDVITKDVAPAALNLAGAVGTVSGKVTDFIGFLQNHEWAMDAFKTVLGAIALVIAVDMVTSLYSMAAAAWAAAIPVIALEAPFYLVAAAVAALIAGIILLIQHWNDLKSAVGDGLGHVGDFLFGTQGTYDHSTKKMAGGGVTSGGPILVGDGSGPELLMPPAGSRVFNAQETQQLLRQSRGGSAGNGAGGGTYNITINHPDPHTVVTTLMRQVRLRRA